MIEYDFYQNPTLKESSSTPFLHARVVPRGTTTSDELAQTISLRSSLTPGDVKAVLVSLSDLMVEQFAQGMRVHLDGLGSFELTLDCPPVKTEREIRAESISVRNVSFRAEKKLKSEVKHLRLQRVRVKNKSKNYSDIEIDDLLTTHFLDHDYITTAEFRSICGQTSSTAGRRLRELVQAGRLARLGHRKSAIYVPTEGNYRR